MLSVFRVSLLFGAKEVGFQIIASQAALGRDGRTRVRHSGSHRTAQAVLRAAVATWELREFCCIAPSHPAGCSVGRANKDLTIRQTPCSKPRTLYRCPRTRRNTAKSAESAPHRKSPLTPACRTTSSICSATNTARCTGTLSRRAGSIRTRPWQNDSSAPALTSSASSSLLIRAWRRLLGADIGVGWRPSRGGTL